MATSAICRATIREVTLINAHSIKGSSAPSHIEYIDISSVGTGEFTEPPALMSFEEAPSRARRIVKAGDTILSTVRPNRRSFLFLSSPSSIAVASTGFAVLTPTPAVDPRYLYYWVTRQDFTDYLSLHAKGAAYPAVSAEDIGNGAIDLPPLAIQRRIAGILSAYDELIENSQRRIKILESMARALYREWFVHFRFPGHESVPRVPSPLGEIPKGWEVKTVAESFEISGGGTPSRKDARYWEGGTIQWFSPSDLTGAGTIFMDDSSDHITALGLAESSARLFPARSVMLTSRATIGAIAINTHEACTNQGFITCLPNERVPLFFLFHWVSENVPTFQRMASGATFKEISRGVFKTIEFVQPPANLVLRFEDMAAPIAEQALALQRQTQNLRRTRDLLLPRLLSGQIDMEAIAS
jgi:type I restriction enzyme S subunit